MTVFLYLAAFVLMATGTSIGERLSRGSLTERAGHTPLYQAFVTISLLATFGWFVYGFFLSWWLPLVGVVAYALLGAALIFLTFRSPRARFIAALFVASGLALGVALLAGAGMSSDSQLH